MNIGLRGMEKGFKQFVVKTGLFIILFILFSFFIGTKLYANNLLSGWKIEIYGRIGYILLFSIAGFILLYRERLLKFSDFKHKFIDYFILGLSFVLLLLFYLFEIYAYKFTISILSIFLVHLLLILTMLLLVFGIYGFSFIINFIKNFRKELFYFLIFGIIMASLMNAVWSLWPYFSFVVLKINAFLLDAIRVNYQIIEPDGIRLGNFAARIGEACSGVYSIFLFTALYLFIIFLDWKKINKKKAGLLFIPAVLGAFFVNVIRVFLLFLIGAFISRELAMGMYHSYTGMIFFLIYFSIFWMLFYKWMKNEPTIISRVFPKDPLYRNSLYLMMGTLIMAFLGFVFWMINARLFTTEEVGLATTIISVMSLITSFSALGLGTGLIRFLPQSERKNDKINTCFTLVALVSILVTTIYILSIKEFSPRLLFIKENLILAFLFIFFMVFASFGSLIDNIFIAYRDTKYIFLKNTIFSVLKIVFPFLLVGLGAYGIFGSWMIGLIVGIIVSLFILIYKFGYRPSIVFYESIIKEMGKYSFGNYIAGFIGGLPTLLLPSIITNYLHPEITAYYYMAMMIAGLLFIIPQSVSNSLFAEGSYDENNLRRKLKKSVKLIALLLIPAIIITIFLGKYVLLLFGEDYSRGGYIFLSILAMGGIFLAMNSIFATMFRVKRWVRDLIVVNCVNAFIILGLSYIWIDRGLMAVGEAWIIGQVFTSFLYSVLLIIKKTRGNI